MGFVQLQSGLWITDNPTGVGGSKLDANFTLLDPFLSKVIGFKLDGLIDGAHDYFQQANPITLKSYSMILDAPDTVRVDITQSNDLVTWTAVGSITSSQGNINWSISNFLKFQLVGSPSIATKLWLFLKT